MFWYWKRKRSATAVPAETPAVSASLHVIRKELPLAMYAVQNIWPQLSEELGVDVEYHQGGNLRLGLTDKDIKVLENHTAKSTKLGLEVEMISGDEARKLCPYMSEEVVAASWCPSDGHANPLKATLGFYRKALQLGVTFVTGVKVMALEKVKGRIRKVITDDGVYEADQILLCAGYESRRIANTVGIDAPVERQFNEVLVTEAQPKMFDIMLGVAGGEVLRAPVGTRFLCVGRQQRLAGVYFQQ